MRKLLRFIFLVPVAAEAQADNEIQVYASPTIEKNWTIFELHSNYTFRGPKNLPDPKSAKWLNETIEITHGFAKNFELGLYIFTAVSPDGSFMYLGNQLRPRVTVPDSWKWNMGASLSLEFGFFRPADTASFEWQGELRPILDKTIGNWYFSLNPNIDFVLSGDGKGVGISPQFKFVYTIKEKTGIGFEYYSSLGSFKQFLPSGRQEHVIGPVIDLYLHPMWEINAGFLFGLTEASNQRVLKLLLGRRRK